MYVNAFTLLAKEVEPSLREFSLSAASLADSVGIALADICGIMVQASPPQAKTAMEPRNPFSVRRQALEAVLLANHVGCRLGEH